MDKRTASRDPSFSKRAPRVGLRLPAIIVREDSTEEKVTIVDVSLRPGSPSFYTLHGDVFAQASTLAAAALLLYAVWKTDGPEPAAVPA